MIPSQPNLPPGTNNVYQITDRHSNVILEIGYTKGWLKDAQGHLQQISRSSSIQLMDGSVWMPLFWQQQHGAIYIGVCDICRETQFAHGLVQLSKSKICTCGRLICPLHAHLCDDKIYRCPRCRKSYVVKSLLRKIFFREIKS